jgi:hypothetical protein
MDYHAQNRRSDMKQRLAVLVFLLLIAVHLGRPVKGDGASKEQQYVRVFYCWNTQLVADQRQSGKHKIVVGDSLPSLDPDSDGVKSCAKSGGVMMTGYVQVTPPFAGPDEGMPPARN